MNDFIPSPPSLYSPHGDPSFYTSPISASLFPAMSSISLSKEQPSPITSRGFPTQSPPLSQAFGFPPRPYPISTGSDFSPSSRGYSPHTQSRRVPTGWSPTPSPNSMTRQLGFGHRPVGGGGGVDQIRREYLMKSQPSSPQMGSPMSDHGSPMSVFDLDSDLLLGSPHTSNEEVSSPAHLPDTLMTEDENGHKTTGRRMKRSRMNSIRSKNRQKHNEAEMRRRRKLNESFDELARVCGTAQAQKATVLKTAIFQIQSLEKHIHATQQRIKVLKHLKSEDLLNTQLAQIKKPEAKEPDLAEPLVKKEENGSVNVASLTFPSLPADIDCKHTSDEAFRVVSTASRPLLEGKKELDFHAQWGSAWKDIHDMVEYKKRTGQIIYNVLQLAQLHLNHQSIFSSSIVMELLCLANGKILDCNSVFCNFFNYSREQATHLTFYQITHPDSLANTYLVIQSLLSAHTQLQQVTHKFKSSDGRGVACQVSMWVAANESRDPYLRMILEPASLAVPRPGSGSPRNATTTSNNSPRPGFRTLTPNTPGVSPRGLSCSRPAGTRRLANSSSINGLACGEAMGVAPSNLEGTACSPPTTTTPTASPLLRVRRQNRQDNNNLAPLSPTGNKHTNSNNSNASLHSHPLLDSPTTVVRLRQLAAQRMNYRNNNSNDNSDGNSNNGNNDSDGNSNNPIVIDGPSSYNERPTKLKSEATELT